VVLLRHRRPDAGLTVVTLHFKVTPPEQADYVVAQASSAKFKYLMGKMFGVPPNEAQKLQLKPVSEIGRFDAEVKLPTADQARRYAEFFLESLQAQCGNQAKLSLVEPANPASK